MAFKDVEQRRTEAKSTFKDMPKHYVRMKGWLPVFENYKRQRKAGVRYFTFCAKGAIDVRYFRHKGVLKFDPDQNSFPTLGYIERDAQDFAYLGETLGQVRVAINGDLEQVLLHPEKFSEDYKNLVATFPYDVINLDYCGEVIRPSDQPYSPTLQSIDRIVSLQQKGSAGDWHLFLTFRACRSQANESAVKELIQILDQNLTHSDAKIAYGNRATPSELAKAGYAEFIRIGVAKFLAHVAAKHSYMLTIDNSFCYKRRADTPDEYEIVKLIIGLSQVKPKPAFPNDGRVEVAYRQTVPRIFRSTVRNVNDELVDVNTRRIIEADFAPVLDELEVAGIET